MPVRGANATPQTPKPLELGAKLLCKWRGDDVKMCEVIERKQNEDTGEWQYYVHYEGLNRRLDEWVPLDRFDLGSQTEEGKLTRTSKRLQSLRFALECPLGQRPWNCLPQ